MPITKKIVVQNLGKVTPSKHNDFPFQVGACKDYETSRSVKININHYPWAKQQVQNWLNVWKNGAVLVVVMQERNPGIIDQKFQPTVIKAGV